MVQHIHGGHAVDIVEFDDIDEALADLDRDCGALFAFGDVDRLAEVAAVDHVAQIEHVALAEVGDAVDRAALHVAGVPGENVVALAAGEHVGALVADEIVAVGRADHRFDAPHLVVAETAGGVVVEIDFHVAFGAREVERVEARAADDLVVAAFGDEQVVAAVAAQLVVARAARQDVVAAAKNL